MNEKNIKNYINSSSLGVYTKYIREVDGTRYLVKSGRGDSKSISVLEPVTECICYELAELMNIPCAEYFLEESDNKVLCVSKWFYDESKEYFYSTNKLMKIMNLSRNDLYSSLVNKMPLCRIDINNMIVFDYIVNNTDRHLKNFGFLMNNDSVRFAPLYDNGLSLGSDLDDEIIKEEKMEDLLLDCDYSKCFDTSNKKQLSLVDEFTLNLDIDYESVVLKYAGYFTDKRIQFILCLLKERIEEVKSWSSQNQN